MAKRVTKRTTKGKERPVIVTAQHVGVAVVFGYTSDTSGTTVHLKRARWAIWWGTMRGYPELAETGPTSTSKISARADVEMRNVTVVLEVKPEAVAAWERA